MIAEIAGKLVAKFIDKSWPNDKEDIYEILRLGINKAWQEGKWLGMTAEFFVPIERDECGQNYIIAPTSHPTLLAMNADGKPRAIRDHYFMFHRNGRGDIKDSKGCKWNQDVYDLGSTPILNKLHIKFTGGVRIGVRSVGQAGLNEKVYINGRYADGNRIYTYKNSEYGTPCACILKENKEEIDTVNGVELAIDSNFNYVPNINFFEITSITKTATKTPVEIIAIDNQGNGTMIARLEPNQRVSSYRKYLVPDCLCNNNCVHGLFKIGEQEEIKHPTDELIVSNEEALICFAKGIHQIYYKEQQEIGASYILQGISVLEKERREKESPTEFPIQVDGIYYEDLPRILNHYS